MSWVTQRRVYFSTKYAPAQCQRVPLKLIEDRFYQLGKPRRRVAVDPTREGNRCGCIPTAAHFDAREPANFLMSEHEISLAMELDFVPRMGTLGVPLAPQKN